MHRGERVVDLLGLGSGLGLGLGLGLRLGVGSVVRVRVTLPLVKVVPDAQSTPNMATISPAAASVTSCISFECMRTSLGTRTLEG